MNRIRIRTSIAAVALFLGAVAPAAAADTYGSFDETYGDDYQAGDLARLTSAANGVTVVRGHADDGGAPDEGTANTPVFAGDTLRTAADQRVEIQLADGTLVRLDAAGELRVQSLPDPYAEYRDHTVLALLDGRVRIFADVRDGETFRIDTPGATVYLVGSGDVRIDTDRDGRTRVRSRQGVAEVAGDGGSVLVRAGQTTTAFPGSYPATPEPFNTLRADAFDRWSDDLDRVWQARREPSERGYADDAAYDDLPYEVRPYYRELSANGRWVYVEDYGWSWYPVTVDVGWRPYLDGGWVYGPNGYFWVGSEPWGWAPYHYGRWSWVPAYGWIWTPGRVFAGAWVSWSWGATYIGWAPIDYWNRPVYYGPVYWGCYASYSWTFVHHHHFTHHGHRGHAVPVDRIGGDLDGRAVSTRPPRVDPRAIRDDAGARRDAVRQVRDGRPALDRGIDRGPEDRAAAERTRFRDAEDRFVRRGARNERVSELRDRGTRDASTSGARAPDDPGARAGRVRESGPRAGGRTDDDGVVPTRPRSIRSEAAPRDERVRDLYRRIQGSEAPERTPAVSRGRASTPDTTGERAPAVPRERRFETGRAGRDDANAVRPQRRDTRTAPSPEPPSRSVAPSRPAPPSRSVAPSKPAPPPRSVAPSKPAPPSRSVAPSKPAPPSRSVAPSKPAPPSRSVAPSKPAPPSRSASPGRSPSPPKSSPGRSGGDSRGSSSRGSGKKDGSGGRSRDR